MMQSINWFNILLDLYIIYWGFNYGRNKEELIIENINNQRTQENQKKRFIILMQMIHQMQSALIVDYPENLVLI